MSIAVRLPSNTTSPGCVRTPGPPRPRARRRQRPQELGELLGRCAQLRAWARFQGFELNGSPDDLEVLDHAIDDVTAGSGRRSPMAAVENGAVFSSAL
jgi:hypothetical protein